MFFIIISTGFQLSSVMQDHLWSLFQFLQPRWEVLLSQSAHLPQKSPHSCLDLLVSKAIDDGIQAGRQNCISQSNHQVLGGGSFCHWSQGSKEPRSQEEQGDSELWGAGGQGLGSALHRWQPEHGRENVEVGDDYKHEASQHQA